ncbi:MULTISPECIES: LytR/AlgR family response regulator transcription factor [Chryseobacterium]|uniref:DNA-binding response regulator n=1 Tax=Chryseobacterium cucumeris TaxID=1813611 RepID=A0ABX9X080_9FLAO|nr:MULTISPECIES: LytTR family DNA-binding domain-containing protein [Chryseobacterium]MDH5033227.1 LytTR family DNA-binding domain-containing protein [Chryseobacterium cucumeris]QWT86834.1 response regulator transcription factor [Chryseobacterium sp. PCH239]RKE81490.1 LytTR family two component transcriptional regulator [Chryseobacterium sp. AG363]ROH87451.1 DNA-binding response regulator [Chryseobacterium cucumeris]WNI37600.1 LytTR family DNA-binding domain-containing protein [Chryseobacteriu
MIQPATKRYNCIIVEDEPIAADILENFISRDPELNLVGKCADAVYASSLLSIHDVDLMFLDLHLPVVKGFDFLRNVKNPPFVIVTTAYHQYAVEGYELDIADYLMKPIPYQRFLTAIGKFKHLMEADDALLEVYERDFIFMNSGKKKVKIILQDIFYIESLREYIHIHTKTETFTFKMPISKMEEILNPKMFARIHKSYIISRSKIEVKSANIIQINGKQLPVGRTYKPLIEL